MGRWVRRRVEFGFNVLPRPAEAVPLRCRLVSRFLLRNGRFGSLLRPSLRFRSCRWRFCLRGDRCILGRHGEAALGGSEGHGFLRCRSPVRIFRAGLRFSGGFLRRRLVCYIFRCQGSPSLGLLLNRLGGLNFRLRGGRTRVAEAGRRVLQPILNGLRRVTRRRTVQRLQLFFDRLRLLCFRQLIRRLQPILNGREIGRRVCIQESGVPAILPGFQPLGNGHGGPQLIRRHLALLNRHPLQALLDKSKIGRHLNGPGGDLPVHFQRVPDRRRLSGKRPPGIPFNRLGRRCPGAAILRRGSLGRSGGILRWNFLGRYLALGRFKLLKTGQDCGTVGRCKRGSAPLVPLFKRLQASGQGGHFAGEIGIVLRGHLHLQRLESGGEGLQFGGDFRLVVLGLGRFQ